MIIIIEYARCRFVFNIVLSKTIIISCFVFLCVILDSMITYVFIGFDYFVNEFCEIIR